MIPKELEQAIKDLDFNKPIAEIINEEIYKKREDQNIPVLKLIHHLSSMNYSVDYPPPPFEMWLNSQYFMCASNRKFKVKEE